MSKKKLAVLNAIRKPGGAYVALSDGVCCEDIGFVNSVKLLHALLAAFATKQGIEKVTVMTGRNVMNVDGPSAKFKVTVKVE